MIESDDVILSMTCAFAKSCSVSKGICQKLIKILLPLRASVNEIFFPLGEKTLFINDYFFPLEEKSYLDFRRDH